MTSSKLTTYLIILWIIEACFVYFIDASQDAHTLFTLLRNPHLWGTNLWLDAFSLVIAGIAAAGAITLSYVTSSDLGVFGAIAGSFIALGAAPVVRIWDYVGNQATLLFGASASGILQLLIVSPIALMYVMAVIAWWRGKEV